MKEKSSLAKVSKEAECWRVLDQAVAKTKTRNAKVPVTHIEAAIDEALQTVRAERLAAKR
jgi:hypothetical protein